MANKSGYILTTGFALCAVAVTSAGAQVGFGGDSIPGGMMGPVDQMGMPTSPEMVKLQKEQADLIKEADPELADYQEKMRAVNSEIAKVVKSFAAQDIDKDEAHAELLPLIRQEQELRNDPDFLAEQRLSVIVFSSPEFQEKMAGLQKKRKKTKGGGWADAGAISGMVGSGSVGMLVGGRPARKIPPAQSGQARRVQAGP